MKRFFYIFLTITLLLVLAACGGSEWQKQYDLGVKYLSDGNYEEAIIAFSAAIEIDEKQPETYIALADVYVQQGDYEKALEILQQGLEKTGNNADIAAKLDQVKNSKALQPQIKREYLYLEDGSSAGYVTYEYNDHGDISEMKGYYQDGTFDGNIRFSTYEYDSNGRKQKCINYDEDNKLKGYYTYEYDTQGNIIQETYYNANDERTEYYINEYDAKGVQTKQTRYSYLDYVGDEVVYLTEPKIQVGIYEYDADGLNTSVMWYGFDGVTVDSRSVFEY